MSEGVTGLPQRDTRRRQSCITAEQVQPWGQGRLSCVGFARQRRIEQLAALGSSRSAERPAVAGRGGQDAQRFIAPQPITPSRARSRVADALDDRRATLSRSSEALKGAKRGDQFVQLARRHA